MAGITVEHPAFLGAVAAAQTAAERDHAAGFTATRISVMAGLARTRAAELLLDALHRGWVRQVLGCRRCAPIRWQLTAPGRQAVAGVQLAAAHRPARRTTGKRGAR